MSAVRMHRELTLLVNYFGGAVGLDSPKTFRAYFAGGATLVIDLETPTSFHVSRWSVGAVERASGTLFSPAFMAAVGSPEPARPHDRALLVVNSFPELLDRVRVLGAMCRNGTGYTTERNGQE